MKKLSWWDKGIFVFNILFAVASLLAYLLPFIPPKTFPFLSILSLGMPVLIIANIVFVIYWILRLKFHFFLSLIILLIGINHLYSFVNIGWGNSEIGSVTGQSKLKILSYNVRVFNKLNWIDDDHIKEKIDSFVTREDPDLFLAQEYIPKGYKAFKRFPYKHSALKHDADPGQVIFSKFPIVNKGEVSFGSKSNKTIYVDIKVKTDTIRVINLHLESLQITSKVDDLQKEDSDQLIQRIGHSFIKQQEQAEKITKLIQGTSYKVIVAGDFNNSAFSYVYHKLSNGLNDSFKKEGSGFGRTFIFDFIPIRIDFILVDPKFKVIDFKNYDVKLSDHFPIMAELSLED